MRKLLAILLSLSMVLFCALALAEGEGLTRFALDSNGGVCYVGHGLQVQIKNVKPEGAEIPATSAFTWTSSNEKVATVDASGLVTGVKRGTARITAALNGVKATYTVTVKQAPTAITISAKRLVLAEGKQERLTATLEPSVCDKRIEWSSSDDSIVTVDQKGNIHCVNAGEATITVTSLADPSVFATIVLATQEPATAVSFSQGEASVKVGDTQALTWTAEPAGSDHAVTFTSNNEKVATVDASGVVTGHRAGRCTITVETADGTRKKDHLTLTVVQPVEGVTLKDSEVRVGVGNYVSLYAVLSPKNATDVNMTWTSADESIATVTGNGLHAKAHGHAWGDTTVTGTTEDGSFTVTATVHVGSFAHALKVELVKIRNGKPYLEVKNVSNLDIATFHYVMRGFDEQVHPVQMATRGSDTTLLYGSYEHEMAPDALTVHGEWSFQHPSDYENLQRLDFAITGFTTVDGFTYKISQTHWNWIEFDSDLYTQIQTNPRAN